MPAPPVEQARRVTGESSLSLPADAEARFGGDPLNLERAVPKLSRAGASALVGP